MPPNPNAMMERKQDEAIAAAKKAVLESNLSPSLKELSDFLALEAYRTAVDGKSSSYNISTVLTRVNQLIDGVRKNPEPYVRRAVEKASELYGITVAQNQLGVVTGTSQILDERKQKLFKLIQLSETTGIYLPEIQQFANSIVTENYTNTYTQLATVQAQVAAEQKAGSFSNFLKTAALMVAPFVLPGVGAAVGSVLAPTATVATQAVIGSAITQGALAEATGGDFLKGAVTGAVSAGIGAYAGDIGTSLGVTDPAIAKIVGNAVITGSASAATGGDFITGAVSGALSAGAGEMTGEALGLDGRAASAVGTSIVKGVVAELQGKDVTDAMIAGAVSGALSYKEQPKAEDIAFEEDFADMMAGKFTIDEVSSGQDITATADASAMFVPKEDVTSKISDSVTDFLSNKTDYSLSSGITFPSTEGLKVEPVTDAGVTVGETPVDYSLNINAPFEGLQMPTSPNITDMGGGQGLTVKTPEGVLSESGVTPTGTAPDLGDPDSFINKPAPDVPDKAPIDPRDALKLATRIIGLAGAGAVVNEVTSGSTRRPVNFEYGDIYKDAPIKGFAMRKGEDGKYTPFIGEKAQLAKGGLASRRK
jgi:hypothetical protein